ncbi:phytoene/squalene synthetase [Breznakibacter xylanolyticus]|uniref:Phytoene/squalene synthetase n=1 Tax=Breznakibacter xylanolyticus TaxID=990 RepID=A0A2W7NSV6_9BACT|nr:phytoene/squalene synthase family protein [Breznakibacter xylanolyticus]PZX16376.1 phytoene/squalene synthetase [Breznakibacter xylanolyticus]
MDALYQSLSFRVSESVTRAYSTSFSVAVRMLAPSMRQAVHAIYGFVRLADEIVDSFHDCDQEHLFALLERDLSEARHMGMSINPVIHAFVQTVDRYRIPDAHIRAFMQSMRADLVKKVYHTQSETSDYIYGSAEVVGLMCLRVFVNGDDHLYESLEQPARKLGAAFQKVNFLRDLKADSEQLQRCYFPELRDQQFSETIKQQLIADMEADFREARAGIRHLPGSARVAVFVAYLYFKQLLGKLKRTPAPRIARQRVRVSDHRKLALFVQAYVGCRLGWV